MRRRHHSELIGTSSSICDLRAEIERIAESDTNVLVTGESGTGKEIVARAVARAELGGAFIAVSCSGIPELLLESELFGRSSPGRDRAAKLELAAGGALFLDEVSELPMRLQGQLLRFLETGEIKKVGARETKPAANVRVVSATKANLPDLIAAGRFREDLFYRINVIHLAIPPLRERREDIPLLVGHFLDQYAEAFGTESRDAVNGTASGPEGHQSARRVPNIAPDAMAALSAYSWPGNVRQLENTVRRLILTTRHATVQLADLPADVAAAGTGHWPHHDRRRTVVDDLLKRLSGDHESFWTTVYPMYMNREITRNHVRELVHKGLEEARGNYRIVLRLFNMEPADYKRFLNFLRKHDCQLPFKNYRQPSPSGDWRPGLADGE